MPAPSTRDRILALFRQHSEGFLSGEEICRQIGVSRTAVWKQIRTLRNMGYRIEGVASQGYRLKERPDAWVPEELRHNLATQVIGQKVICLDTTGSTNTVAHSLGEEGAPDGTLVLAETQTGGRGRLGRCWESPGGVNLYLSVLLRPRIAPSEAAPLTFLSAVAVAQALEIACDVAPQVKWPNDLLLNGKKVAGLLNEMQAEMEQIHYLVLGIGVNLNMSSDQFPKDLRYPATSVSLETGQPVNRLHFARTLIGQLDQLYATFLTEGPGPILRQWEQRCALQGQQVRVSGGTDAMGILRGIDADGALLVENEQGVQRVLSGDVTPL